MTKLIQRTITAILYVILIIGSIILSPYLFFSLGFVFNVLAVYELYRLVQKKKDITSHVLIQTTGAFLYILSFLWISGMLSAHLFWIILLPLFTIPVTMLFRKTSLYADDLASTYFILIYATVPLILLNAINLGFIQNNFSSILLSIFVLIWTNDTGAYLIGMLIGRNKLFPRISPQKSWEGFFGGIVFTIIMSFVLWKIFGYITLTEWLLFGFIISISSVLGDLVESALKRSAGVKDSGTILPGHGGILDRIDSLLLAAPVAFIFLKLTV